MSVMDTKILNVDDKAHSYAKVYASLINDELQRKRAYASIVALYSLIAELEKTNFDVQKSMTLFRNPVINGQYEIADVYVNNWHIDVRVVTEGNGFLVPKSHFDVDIVPDFYAVVRVDNSLKTAELLGFVDTAFLNKEPFVTQLARSLSSTALLRSKIIGRSSLVFRERAYGATV